MKKTLLAIVFAAAAAAACSETKSPAPAASATPPASPALAATPTAATPTAAAATPVAGEPAMIAVGTKMKCPVSDEEFTVKPTTTQVVYNGKRFAFCCSDCKPEFEKNPAKFAAKQ
jgi:YHS domain-containing protein